MPTHEHEQLSITDGDGAPLSKYFHDKCSRFARLLVAHDPTKSKGSIFGQRVASVPKKSGLATLMNLMYEHNNPVRAGFVDHPRKWPYSSYNFYAYGKIRFWWEHFLTPLPEYLALGSTPKERQSAFRALSEAFGEIMRAKREANMGLCRGLSGRWKAVGDAEFIREFVRVLDERLRGVAIDSSAQEILGQLPIKRSRTEGDPDPAQFSRAKALPACCWIHMDTNDRMLLKNEIGKAFKHYRRVLLAQRPSAPFQPPAELIETLGPAPAGFRVAYAYGQDIGMMAIARRTKEVRAAREKNRSVALTAPVVDKDETLQTQAEDGERNELINDRPGHDTDPNRHPVPLDSPLRAGEGCYAPQVRDDSDERPMAGQVVPPNRGAESGDQSEQHSAGEERTDATVRSIEEWGEKWREFLETFGFDLNEVLEILRGPDEELFRRRKKSKSRTQGDTPQETP